MSGAGMTSGWKREGCFGEEGEKEVMVEGGDEGGHADAAADEAVGEVEERDDVAGGDEGIDEQMRNGGDIGRGGGAGRACWSTRNNFWSQIAKML
ncbi:hypothetical protein NL676_029226 [Syzygium grande]|nr:hypothetical protein NL676_029226 [Syzygium grande]